MNFEEKKYTCIFGGGAIRGLSYIGAIQALNELGIQIETLAGSSVGAIIAGLLAVGYNEDEIKNLFLKVNFDLFRDIHFGFGKAFALSKGEVFLEWVREKIESKFYGEYYKKGENPTVKFKDLDKDLVIITTNLTNFESKEFSKTETPDFEVATAIRISSSMPGLMTPIYYKNSELVDGDLQKSWPLWKLSKTLEASKNRILEFRLEGDYDAGGKTAVDYLNTVYSCVTSIATKGIVKTYGYYDKYDFVTINTGDVLLVDFNLPQDKRNDLMEIGYKQTINYFKTFLPQKYEKLSHVYFNLLLEINDVLKFLTRNDIIQAKVSLGKVYMHLCEIDIKIDENIYANIQNTKYRLFEELKPSIFGKYPKEAVKSLTEDFKQIEECLELKLKEMKN